jgi:hypothetical protein
MTGNQIALLGVVVAIIAGVIALLAWLRPRRPKAPLDKNTDPIRSVEDAYRLYEFLIKHEGQRVWLNVMIDPHLVMHEPTEGEDYDFFFIKKGETELVGDNRQYNETSGIQFNLFGLTPKDIENTFGWGGGSRGYQLRGSYLVVDHGIGTGAIVWAALQARQQAP